MGVDYFFYGLLSSSIPILEASEEKQASYFCCFFLFSLVVDTLQCQEMDRIWDLLQ